MRIKRQKKEDVEVPLASMADIAFLLIIFFVLAAQFVKEKNIKYELPVGPELEKVEKTPIFVTIDEAGHIYCQGEQTSEEAVEGRVAAEINSQGIQKVHFKCDANQPRSVYEPVIIAISEAGGTIIPIADEGEPRLR